jgi:hypothetical protein
MTAKYVTDLMRKVEKQGGRVESRPGNGGKLNVYGPKGMIIVHQTPGGGNQNYLRVALKRIGFDV